jgi:hypothetical protein
VWELDRFDHVGPDLIALDGKLVSQANRLGAPRSGGCDKHLDVDRLRDRGQCFLGLGLQVR